MPEVVPVRVEVTVRPSISVAPVVSQPNVVSGISQDVACVKK